MADCGWRTPIPASAWTAGDPTSDYSLEPASNGSRINLGFKRECRRRPNPLPSACFASYTRRKREITFRKVRVRWAAIGPWATNDQIKIEYSPDNGTNWLGALHANPLDFNNGIYTWDVSALATGASYRVRVAYLSDTNVADATPASFTILDPSGKIVYVNDDSTDGDEWCTEVGNYTNTGLAASSPLDSFQAVVDRYPEIGAGDEVRLDNGNFDFGRTLYLNDYSSGIPSAKLVIRGTRTGAALINRLDTINEVV